MAAFGPLLGLPGIWGDLMGTLPPHRDPRARLLARRRRLDPAPSHGARGDSACGRASGSPGSGPVSRARSTGPSRSSTAPALGWSLRNRLATVALGVLSLALGMGLLGGGWVPVETTPPVRQRRDHRTGFPPARLLGQRHRGGRRRGGGGDRPDPGRGPGRVRRGPATEPDGALRPAASLRPGAEPSGERWRAPEPPSVRWCSN